MQDFVVFDHVCKTYQMGDVRIEALKDASFTIDEGDPASSSASPARARPRS